MAEDYGVSEETLSADNLIAGDAKRVEDAITVKSGSGELSRGALLGRRDSDGKYEPIDPGTTYEDEDIGDGDSSTQQFQPTLAHPGIKPETLVITATLTDDSTETLTARQDGKIVSDSDDSIVGYVNHGSGYVDVTFVGTPKTGTDILATYVGGLTAVTDENLGTGDGSETEWEGALASTKVVPGSVYIYTNESTPKTLRDDGDGHLIGDDGRGTIDYDTGIYYIEFDAAVADTKTIDADYCTYDGTETARCVLLRDIDATSADVKVKGYFTGEFDKTTVFANHTGLSTTQQQEIINDCRERGIHIKARITGA